MKIFSSKSRQAFREIKFLGISLYKKQQRNNIIEKRYLMGLIKIKKAEFQKSLFILGLNLFSWRFLNDKELIERIKSGIMTENRALLSVYNLHSQIFPKFKYCNYGKKVVIVGCGPTLNYYTPINKGVHIALNKAYRKENIDFDYLFMVDSAHKEGVFEEIEDLDCIKFLGFHCNPEFSYCNSRILYNPNNEKFSLIPEIHVIRNNAYRFYSNAHRDEIFYDIETSPLMDFGSVSFPALHFAFYTHPEKIYLVGCDSAQNGYFDAKTQPQNRMLDRMLFGYKKLKKFASVYYPETEIISVNPVGLKGLFEDVYTRSYIQAHPEILEQNPNIIYLDEIENEEIAL